MEKKIVKYTEEELKQMKGTTQWAKLIEKEKSSQNSPSKNTPRKTHS